MALPRNHGVESELVGRRFWVPNVARRLGGRISHLIKTGGRGTMYGRRKGLHP